MGILKKSLPASLVGISLLASGSLMAQSNNNGRTTTGCDTSKLNLTDAQKKQIDQLKPSRGLGNQGNGRAQIQQEREAYIQQSNVLIRQKNFDENKALTLIHAQINKDNERLALKKTGANENAS